MIRQSSESFLWKPSVPRKQGLKALSVDARLILGILGTCDGLSDLEIADAINATADRVKQILAELYSSHDRTIRDALEYGISLDAAVVLPNYRVRLHCKECRQPLLRVPCCRCLSNNPEAAIHRRRPPSIWESTILRKPSRPTKHLPGTRGKLEVMRRRVTRRCQPFHPADAMPDWDG